MIFKADTLKIDNSNKSIFSGKDNNSDNNFENTSFFFEALDIISEDNKIFYQMINENEIEPINEKGIVNVAFNVLLGKMSFSDLLNQIIEAFINALEKLWNYLKSALLSFFGKDQIIKSYKNKLRAVSFDVKYNGTIYKFTNLGSNTSYTSYNIELEKCFSDLYTDLLKFKGYNADYNKVYSDLNQMKVNLQDKSYLDIIRGKSINNSNGVTEPKFADELFKFFRNDGKAEYTNGVINGKTIEDAYDCYFNYTNYTRSIEKDKNDMKKSAKDIEKRIKDLKIEDFIGYPQNQETQKAFMDVLQSAANRVNETCGIFLQVFSAKLDAFKDYLTQSRNILYQTCKYLTREGIK